MKINQAFPSKYIKAGDLGGKEFTLTISKVTIEDVGGAGTEEEKPILYFAGRQKGVVLNRTNATAISHPDTVMFQGKMVDCIRMRVPAQAADPSMEIPF